MTEETAKKKRVVKVVKADKVAKEEKVEIQPGQVLETTSDKVSDPIADRLAAAKIEMAKESKSIQANSVESTPTTTSNSNTSIPQATEQKEASNTVRPKFAMAKRDVKVVPVVPLQKLLNQKKDYNQNTNQMNTNSNSRIVTGFLDNSRDGHGIIRVDLSTEDESDAYISVSQIRRLGLKPGDIISGPAREPKENERFWGMLKVDTVNGLTLDEYKNIDRVNFKKLTPVYPDAQIKLETGAEPLSLRIIDMVAPIGKGQRSLIVSPPKAGKTSLLKNIASGVASNHPDIHIIAVLVGERPEEVTDIKRHIATITGGKGEVAASNFDEAAQDQCRVAELALERAKRLVEEGKDVLVLLDSITRLARAYNLAIPTSGRTLSGGFDPAALFPPKKFFGAARNFEIQGSLTIVGTALVETGSRMDDLIYEEFKGTGNQEVHLDRRLAERRIFPAIDVQRSGTRRDDLLIGSMEYQAISTLHRMLDTLDKEERTQTLIEQLKKSKSNKEFLASLKNG